MFLSCEPTRDMITQPFALLWLLTLPWSGSAFQHQLPITHVNKHQILASYFGHPRQQPQVVLQAGRNPASFNDSVSVENCLQSQLSSVAVNVACSLLLVALWFSFPSVSLADEDVTTSASTTAPSPITIQLCVRNEPGVPTNCVSTANVRQYDLYSPPWTFASSISASEVLARLKGAIQNTYGRDLVDLTQVGDASIQAHVTRNLIATDELDFVVNPNDRVVIFSAREQSPTPRVSDFGALRQRLEQIRKTAGVFGVMGDALQDTADGIESSYYESLKQDQSPLGQLKAFYGLQSGEGFEDVFDD